MVWFWNEIVVWFSSETNKRLGTSIGPLDTLIGAHAKSLGLTIVTNNEKEFERIAGLKIENWTKE